MYEATEYLLNKPDRPMPDVKPEELPKEIEEMRNQIQKALAAKQINDFKNEIVINLESEIR